MLIVNLLSITLNIIVTFVVRILYSYRSGETGAMERSCLLNTLRGQVPFIIITASSSLFLSWSIYILWSRRWAWFSTIFILNCIFSYIVWFCHFGMIVQLFCIELLDIDLPSISILIILKISSFILLDSLEILILGTEVW